MKIGEKIITARTGFPIPFFSLLFMSILNKYFTYEKLENSCFYTFIRCQLMVCYYRFATVLHECQNENGFRCRATRRFNGDFLMKYSLRSCTPVLLGRLAERLFGGFCRKLTFENCSSTFWTDASL